MRRNSLSDEALTFVFFALTREDEVICISEAEGIRLPQYEFQVRHGNECITDALARQMPDYIGYAPANGKVALAETGIRGTGETKKASSLAPLRVDDDDEDDGGASEMPEAYGADFPFRVCVAHACIPHITETADEDTAPFVKWARMLMEYTPFLEWDRARKARIMRKQHIILVPQAEWYEMICDGGVTDGVSVIATEAARAWLVQPKFSSFAQKKEERREARS